MKLNDLLNNIDFLNRHYGVDYIIDIPEVSKYNAIISLHKLKLSNHVQRIKQQLKPVNGRGTY